MDCSPPRQPEGDAQAPDSPAHSEYSIDLNAMTQDTHEDAQSPLPTRQIDEVRSEDIDGPSDFTLHLEDWMRGLRNRKGPAGGTISKQGTLNRGSVRGTFAQTREEVIDEAQEEEISVAEEDKTVEGEEKHMLDTPQVIRDSSVWDAYGNPSPSPSVPSSPPQAMNKRFLQPTVEDYNSELSPGPSRPLSAPVAGHEPSRLSNVFFPSTPDRKDSPQQTSELDDLRAQLKELRILHESTELKAQLLEEQLKAVEESRHELRQQLDANNVAMEQTTASAKQAADAASTEVSNLRRAVSSTQAEADELKTQLEEMRASEDVELEDLRKQLLHRQGLETELKSQIGSLTHQLTSAKDENTALKAAVVEAQRDNSTDQLAEAQRTIDHLREELELLQDLSRLDDAAADHEAEVAELRKQLDEANARADAQPSTPPAQQQAAQDNSEELHASERKRLELHAALDSVRAELSTLREANAAMDERVAATLGKQEDTWKARQAEWEAERKVMVKALLRGWGREELGASSSREQKYRYQHGVRTQ